MNIVEEAVIDELKWLFREQPIEDYGIDAHVELVTGEEVTGALLGLQIKGGESYFREPSPNGWWFRPDSDDVHYWLNHSLPVMVVLVDTDTRRCYWQVVRREALIRTSRGGWKMEVPKAHVLDSTAAEPLYEAAQGDPYMLRIRELQLARPWMDLLASGKRLVVDIEEWVNKTSGRGAITLGIDNEDGEAPEEIVTWVVLLGMQSYAEVVPRLFAWADVSLHEETYADADYDAYEAECVRYDEGDRFYVESFEDWTSGRSHDPLRPYANEADEVDRYRWELTLNDLGRAFLTVDGFAAKATSLLTADPLDGVE